MGDYIQIIINNLYLVGTIALYAMGIVLTFKTVNVANFAQGMTSVVGAYTAAWLFRDCGANLWVASLLGILASFMLGVFIDAGIIQRIAGGTSRVMVTIGLIVLITAALPIVYGVIPYSYSRFFEGNLNFRMFGRDFYIVKNCLFIFVVCVVVIAIIALALRFTKWGLGVRSTSSNATVAAMMGVNTNIMTTLSWAISSACGALAAIFYASQTTSVNVSLTGFIDAYAMLAFVVGGITSFWAPAVAAAIMPVLLVSFGFISNLWASSMVYGVVVIIMFLRPQGLFGKKTVTKI